MDASALGRPSDWKSSSGDKRPLSSANARPSSVDLGLSADVLRPLSPQARQQISDLMDADQPAVIATAGEELGVVTFAVMPQRCTPVQVANLAHTLNRAGAISQAAHLLAAAATHPEFKPGDRVNLMLECVLMDVTLDPEVAFRFGAEVSAFLQIGNLSPLCRGELGKWLLSYESELADSFVLASRTIAKLKKASSSQCEQLASRMLDELKDRAASSPLARSAAIGEVVQLFEAARKIGMPAIQAACVAALREMIPEAQGRAIAPIASTATQPSTGPTKVARSKRTKAGAHDLALESELADRKANARQSSSVGRRRELAQVLAKAMRGRGKTLTLKNVPVKTLQSADTTLMRALARARPDVHVVVLPRGMERVPSWVGAFGHLRTLSAEGFAGESIDIRSLPTVQVLNIRGFSFASLRVQCMEGCQAKKGTKCPPHETFIYGKETGKLLRREFHPTVNVNELAQFDASTVPIKCMHLTSWVLLMWPLNADAHLSLTSKEKVVELLGSKQRQLSSVYAGIRERLASNFEVSFAHWGKFVTHVFQQMDQNKTRTLRIFLGTYGHAMCARLRIQTDAYHLDFVDPNTLGIPKTVSFDQANGFRSLRFDSMLEPMLSAFYARNGASLVAALWPTGEPIPHKVPKNRTLSFEFAAPVKSWNPFYLRRLLRANHFAEPVKRLLNALDKGELSPKHARHLVVEMVGEGNRKFNFFQYAVFLRSSDDRILIIGRLLLKLRELGVLTRKELSGLLLGADRAGVPAARIRIQHDGLKAIPAIQDFTDLLVEAYQSRDGSGKRLLAQEDVQAIWDRVRGSESHFAAAEEKLVQAGAYRAVAGLVR